MIYYRGDVVKSTDGNIGVVVFALESDKDDPANWADYTTVVWRGENYVSLALTEYLTLVSRPSQGGMLVEVNRDDLERDDEVFIGATMALSCFGWLTPQFKCDEQNNTRWKTYRYVEGDATEPTVEDCKRVLRKKLIKQQRAVMKRVREIGRVIGAIKRIPEEGD